MSCYYQVCVSALVDTIKGALAQKEYTTSPAVSRVTAVPDTAAFSSAAVAFCLSVCVAVEFITLHGTWYSSRVPFVGITRASCV